jgi:hypothetical protein
LSVIIDALVKPIEMAVEEITADGEATFLDRLEAFAPGTPTIFSSYVYECVNVIALASLAAGSTDPEVFVAEMTTVTNGGTGCISYADITTEPAVRSQRSVLLQLPSCKSLTNQMQDKQHRLRRTGQ